MDVINKIKNFLEDLYDNKIFKFFFFGICIILVFYHYGHLDKVKEKIKSNPSKIMDEINIPKKINIIKQKRRELANKSISKRKKIEKRKKEIKHKILKEKKNKEKLHKKRQKLKKLNNDFKSNIQKNAHILKKGEFAKIKLIIISNGFTLDNEPIETIVKINNKKNNFFGRKLIGKKVGEVVVINIKELIKDKYLRENIKKSIDNIDQLNILNKAYIIYKIKILGTKNR